MRRDRPASESVAADCGAFYCYPITAGNLEDTRDMRAFVPVHESGSGLAEYLNGEAWKDERKNLMRTYLVRDGMTNELAGFFSLKAGVVATNERRIDGRVKFDSIPSVELACLAVDGGYRTAHPDSAGCGLMFFRRLVVPIVLEASRRIGVAMIHLFALPDPEGKVVANYRSYGFRELPPDQADSLNAQLKPRVDLGCVFMRIRL